MDSSIATYQSDLDIRVREWNKGHEAFRAGKDVSTNPWNSGLTYHWWLDGFYSRNYPLTANSQGSHIPS